MKKPQTYAWAKGKLTFNNGKLDNLKAVYNVFSSRVGGALTELGKADYSEGENNRNELSFTFKMSIARGRWQCDLRRIADEAKKIAKTSASYDVPYWTRVPVADYVPVANPVTKDTLVF